MTKKSLNYQIDPTDFNLGSLLTVTHTYKGKTITATLGEALDTATYFGTPVCLYDHGAGTMRVKRANADSTGVLPAIGLLVSGGADEGECTILIDGMLCDTGWAWTIGDMIFLDDTVGTLVASASAPTDSGDILQIIGYAASATCLIISPHWDYQTVS